MRSPSNVMLNLMCCLFMMVSPNLVTRIFNLTGQPAMSVPLFWNESNIPIGVQFAGRFGDEETLFKLAAQLERSRPWVDKIPPVHCINSFKL